MKVLKFYATWCSTCKGQKVEFEKNVINGTVINLDVDEVENIRFTNGFNIKQLPTVILCTDEFDSSVWGDDHNNYKDVEVKRWTGFVKAEEVNKAIDEYEKKHPQDE